jgi:hypothetical protein
MASLQPEISSNSIRSVVERAGHWYLHSGIREASGGVARYYYSDRRQNAKVSTEITGYAVSALVYLHHLTKDPAYLDAALGSAAFLRDQAWSAGDNTMPFEIPSAGEQGYAYFFDLGIIVRGLLMAWRASGDASFLEKAKETGLSMAYDFMAEEAVHPILTLPDKQPLDYDPLRWSQSPGCYQLKSAMAWWDLAVATGVPALKQPYERMLEYSLATHETFLPGHPDRLKVMDRLHAYSYFLEALLPVGDRPVCREALRTGIDRVAFHLRDVAPDFARSDVYAQLLRVRLFADRLGFVPLDCDRAAEEAAAIQAFARAEDGGFWFGRKHGEFLPFINPVSAAFCLQALAMWDGDRDVEIGALI